MKEECLICKAPLEYLEIDVPLWLAAMLHRTINALKTLPLLPGKTAVDFPVAKPPLNWYNKL